MTQEEALKLRRFDHHCTCGGYAYSMNGRDPARPHMAYCLQGKQYNEWYDAINGKGDEHETDRNIG